MAEKKTTQTALIPSVLYDEGKKKIQPVGILLRQFGKGRFGLQRPAIVSAGRPHQ